MKIVNFKASYIKPAFVQKKQDGKYKSKEVSFVEFSPNSGMDLDTISDLEKSWKYSFLPEINKSFMYKYNEHKHLYGLVDQQKNYEKIEPENVLGLMYFDEQNNKTSEIEYFQVHPKYKHMEDDYTYPSYQKPKRERTYKEVGESLLNAIKAKYCNYLITAVPTENAEPFYIQHDFEYDDDYRLQMHWRKKCPEEDN